SRSKVLEVGQVAVLDQLPADARAQLDKVLNVTRKDDEAAAVESVRKGDYAAAISEQGNTVVVRYSAADQVQSATVQGILSSLVQESNLAASGAPPHFSLHGEQV